MSRPSKVPVRIKGWFLPLILVHIPNDISIGSAVFAGHTIVTDRQIDRRRDLATPSATTGRIYVRSTAMRPKHVTKIMLRYNFVQYPFCRYCSHIWACV